MIKQLRYLCTLLLMAVVGVAWGEVGDVVYTFATEKNTTNTAYASNYDVTINGLTWSVPGNQNFEGYVRIGGKSLTNVDRLITGKSSISAAIGKITVNHNGISNANLIVNKVTLTVASDADFSNVIDTKVLTPTFEAGVEGSFDFDPSSTGWPENCYYKFTFNFTNSKSSNYGLDVKSIVFYEGVAGVIQEKTDPNLSFSQDAITADLNESFTPPTLSNEENVDVYWNSSAPNVASVDENGNVTLLAEGTTTITASFDGDDDYKASSASYTLTVVDGSLITIWSEDWSGLEDLPSEGNNATYEFNSVGATFYSEQNTAGGTAPEIMLKKNGGALTVAITSLQTCTGDLTLFYYTNQDSKLAITASDENIEISESASLGTKAYKRTISLNGATSLVLTFTASDANTNVRLDNLELKGSPTGVVKENAEIENFEDQTIDVEAGDDLEISFAATATSNATVTYAVAEGGSFVENDDFQLEGNVLTIITKDKDGTIKITASAEETEEFLAASKTITITVNAPARTLENIAELTALTTEGDYTVALTDALVTYVNGTKGYIEDASGAVMLYGAEAVGELKARDKITGTATVTYTIYNGLPELTTMTLAEGYTKTENNVVTPTVVTLAELNGDNYSSYISRYVKIEEATVVSAFTDKNSTIKQGEASIVLRDQNKTATLTTKVDDVVTVTAHPSIFNTTKQIAVYEQSQIVVKEDNREAAGIAFSPATLTITQGDKDYTTPEFVNPNNINQDDITFTSTNKNVADWDDTGLVFGSETGTATITATFEGNTAYKPATATLVVTVNENLNFVEVVEGCGIYQKITSAADLEAGKRYLIVGYKASETAYYAYNGFDEDTSKKYGLAATVTVNNDRIDNTESAATPVVLQKYGDNWFIMDGDNFLAYNLSAGTDKNNNLFAVSEATADGTSWIIDFESTNGYLITNAYNTERSLEFNSDRFACYKHSQQDVVLYKELQETPVLIGDVNQDDSVTIADVTALVNIILGKVTTENNPDNYNFDAADVDRENGITVADVEALVNLVLKQTNE